MGMIKLKMIRLSLILLIGFLGCYTQLLAQSKSNKKKELVLSITDNSTGTRIKAIQPIADYLSKELKMKVVATTSEKELDLLESVKNQKVDIGFINTFGYVLGKSDSLPISLLVVPGKENGKPSVYNSCIISAKSKRIQSLEALVQNAEEHSFMFVNPTSASGHLVPRLYFKKLGIEQAESSFKVLSFGDNHYATIDKIVNGEVDAGAVAYNILMSLVSKGEVRLKDIDILWVSDEIPQTPTIINENMDKKLQEKVYKAMLNIHKKDPKLWGHIQNEFSARDASNFIVAKDEYYNSIRKISGSMDDLLFILNFYLF